MVHVPVAFEGKLIRHITCVINSSNSSISILIEYAIELYAIPLKGNGNAKAYNNNKSLNKSLLHAESAP